MRQEEFNFLSADGHTTIHGVEWTPDGKTRAIIIILHGVTEKAYALWNWYRLPEWIVDIAERMRMVQIENRPALEVIERFNYSNVFMYIDPPYLLSTRTGKQYKHEMSDADHEDLLKLLLQSKAKIMISGYESDLYNEYLSKWEKKEFSSCAEHGKPRLETVWMNYKADLQMSFEDFPEVMP